MTRRESVIPARILTNGVQGTDLFSWNSAWAIYHLTWLTIGPDASIDCAGTLFNVWLSNFADFEWYDDFYGCSQHQWQKIVVILLPLTSRLVLRPDLWANTLSLSSKATSYDSSKSGELCFFIRHHLQAIMPILPLSRLISRAAAKLLYWYAKISSFRVTSQEQPKEHGLRERSECLQ
jgi:hypothetical protein